MLVRELIELLKQLPEDANVIVSEKFGRGGPIQGYIIGELAKDGMSVNGVSSNSLQLYKLDILNAERSIEKIKKELVHWELAETDNDCDVLRDDEGNFVLQTWAGDYKKFSKKKLLQRFEKQLNDAKKGLDYALQKKHEVNSIELSCNF